MPAMGQSRCSDLCWLRSLQAALIASLIMLGSCYRENLQLQLRLLGACCDPEAYAAHANRVSASETDSRNWFKLKNRQQAMRIVSSPELFLQPGMAPACPSPAPGT